MKKVLFVCLGNICRSPLAEGIFNHKVAQSGLSDKVTSDSAGTASYHIGETPDTRSIATAKNHGIILKHRGQQFEKYHTKSFEYIIAMDQYNYRDIINTSGHQPEKLFLMRAFDPIDKNADVPDPYYGGDDGFEEVYQILDRSIDQLIDYIKKDLS